MDATKSTPAAVVRHKRPLPITSAADIQWYGQQISQTKFFGEITPPEGVAIVSMCHMEGWTLSEFVDTYNVMHHRLAKKTDAIIVDFDKREGSSKEVVQRTSECAEVKLSLGKTKYVSKVTWDDCKAEPFVYEGRQEAILAAIQRGEASKLAIKAKYATPRSRMQMLWARAISDGVRVVCPACVQGIYTPEEVEDFDDDPGSAAAAPSAAVPQQPAPQPAQPAQPSNPELCPACGNPQWEGQRWDNEDVFSLEVLKQALAVQHPSFTPEMKQYIAQVIAYREAAAAEAKEGAQ